MPKITPIDYHPDSETIFSRFIDLPYACWLDSGKPSSNSGRYDIISARPVIRITSDSQSTQRYFLNDHGQYDLDTSLPPNADPVDIIKEEIAKLSHTRDIPMPFTGGVIGYFAYDFGRRYMGLANEDTNKPKPAFDHTQLGIYHWAIIQDHRLQCAWIVSLPECDPELIEEVHKRLSSVYPRQEFAEFNCQQLNANISQNEYLEALDRIHDYILAGDCYQVNFAQRFTAKYKGHPFSIYKPLRKAMASPFSAYLQLDKQVIMSLSPERFIQVKARQVLAQPIKGTAPRSKNKEEDQQLAIDLQNDLKNRAENLMIVDLLRNDIGKHCVAGSIEVENLFGLESYPNVHHLVSNVRGCLKEDIQGIDLIRDSFPGGSITGAPKKRAMEIIDELEAAEREVYCGSIGFINNNGDLDTNITIRTVSCDGDTLYCWGGGGIVADSNPEEEYEESLNKINKILSILKVDSSQ
jgi:para-aminobenzoate synthetase component 1